MNRFIIFTILFCLPAMVKAQINSAKNIEEVKEVCLAVTTNFKDENIEEAFKILRKIWPLPDSELIRLELQTTKQFNLLQGSYGKALEIKLTSEQLIEDVAVRLVYVIKYERHLLRLVYVFYQGDQGLWTLNTFKWNDDIDALFQD